MGLLDYYASSPDGRKVAHVMTNYGLEIFDFDRCTGKFSNPISIPYPQIADSTWIGLGLAFSPSGRFLYFGMTQYVFQYDLWATNIPASVDTVAIYDGFEAPFGSYFATMQRGPDGKIYESCGSSEYVLHVIEEPDKKGDSCKFLQHGLKLPSYCLGVPSFPNYRLGA
jgi:hypothetical protein